MKHSPTCCIYYYYYYYYITWLLLLHFVKNLSTKCVWHNYLYHYTKSIGMFTVCFRAKFQAPSCRRSLDTQLCTRQCRTGFCAATLLSPRTGRSFCSVEEILHFAAAYCQQGVCHTLCVCSTAPSVHTNRQHFMKWSLNHLTTLINTLCTVTPYSIPYITIHWLAVCEHISVYLLLISIICTGSEIFLRHYNDRWLIILVCTVALLQGRMEVLLSGQANKMTWATLRFKFLNIRTQERKMPGTVGHQIFNIWGLANINIQVTVPGLWQDIVFAAR